MMEEFEPYNKETLGVAMSVHGNIVKGKNYGDIWTILAVHDNSVDFSSHRGSFIEILMSYVWNDDGSPCGVPKK